MRGMVALFGLAMALTSAMAQAREAPASAEIVGRWTRPDGFQQTTLISRDAAIQFAVPGDWTAVRFDFKLPVATAVYDVPDPSRLQGGTNTNCSMTFADASTPEGQGLVARVAALGPVGAHDGWTVHKRKDTAGAATTIEAVAAKSYGRLEAIAMCAWPEDGPHDAIYDAYMTRIFQTLLDSVGPAPARVEARPGETFFSPQ